MPEFSFVIPCYQSEYKISKCLGSILDQDFKDFEVICVLDGPDEIAKKLIQAFGGVQCYEIEHGGVQKARNFGLSKASGKYVIFSDPDMYWDPGVLRLHKEAFDKHGVDFTYSGYRWPDERPGHVPLEFDPYLFTVFNYVDGANPVRTDLVRQVGGWREGVNRFQDWDLWIRIIKAGGVGRKLDIDTSRVTEPPNKESISGKYDYDEWYHKVRKLNDLPDREICVTSIAAQGHALRVAKACGWDYWHDPRMLPKKYKAIYLLGMFPESVAQHVSLFMDGEGNPRDSKYIVHWIGTDVLNMRMKIPFLDAKNIRMMFEKRNTIHLCQSDQNAEEMREIGFRVKTIPLPVVNEFEKVPLPEEFTVSVYDHGGIEQKWHKWLIIELIKAMPDVKWLFYGSKDSVGKRDNQEWLGHVPIKEVIKKSSCHLRLTVHDGYPVAPVEFMLSGRKVITNVPDMKFTNHVDIGVVNEERVVEIKQLVYNEIRKVQKCQEFENYDEVRTWYEYLLSPERYKASIEEIVNE